METYEWGQSLNYELMDFRDAPKIISFYFI